MANRIGRILFWLSFHFRMKKLQKISAEGLRLAIFLSYLKIPGEDKSKILFPSNCAIIVTPKITYWAFRKKKNNNKDKAHTGCHLDVSREIFYS